jgi:hypothetical protein
MKRALALLLLLSAVLAAVVPWAMACGDKFLVAGRCVSYQRVLKARHPGNVAILDNPTSKAAAEVRSSKVKDVMEQAGHRVTLVGNVGELETGLGPRSFDVVILDLSDAAQVEQSLRNASAKTIVLPLMYRASKADLSQAKEQYAHTLNMPSRRNKLLSALDDAVGKVQ